MNSSISSFHKLSPSEKILKLTETTGLHSSKFSEITQIATDSISTISENVIASFTLPLSIAFNFKINQQDILVPLVTEESSVVAAASNAAKLVKINGGFTTEVTRPVLSGMIYLYSENSREIDQFLQTKRGELIKLFNENCPTMVKRGGGCFDAKLERRDDYVAIKFLCDTRSSFGANFMNTTLEAVSIDLDLLLREFTYETIFKILSNQVDDRRAIAKASISAESLVKARFAENTDDAKKLMKRLVHAYKIASIDKERGLTHSKGVLNGVIAFTTAIGNDTRAMMVANQDTLFTNYWIEDDILNITCSVCCPLGTVGGLIGSHHGVSLAFDLIFCPKVLKDMNISAYDDDNARELVYGIAAAVGLANNLAALLALTTKGIQKGHMSLHLHKMMLKMGVDPLKIDDLAKLYQESYEIVSSKNLKNFLDKINK